VIKKFSLSTHSRSELIDISSQVEDIVKEARVEEGTCRVFVPHTTAGILINEGADPSVRRDILNQLDKIIPWSGDYQHREGNSPAHIKASLVGSSETIFVEKSQLVLGTWQAIYFCEFDGPRHRQVIVKIE
jgi:secondary thiamine-phosphate synthase enzyme